MEEVSSLPAAQVLRFTATSGTTGSERVDLGALGQLQAVSLESGSGPILVAMEYGTFGVAVRLDSGYIRGSDIDITNVQPLIWHGSIDLVRDAKLIVFWANSTGADVTLILEWVER